MKRWIWLEKYRKHVVQCPFCGNSHACEIGIRKEEHKIELSTHIVWNVTYAVSCSCGAQGSHGDNVDDAIDKWNGMKIT